MTEIFISVATWILWLHVTINMSSDPAWMPVSFVDTCPKYKGKLRKTNWCLIPLKVIKTKNIQKEKKNLWFYLNSILILIYFSHCYFGRFICVMNVVIHYLYWLSNPCLKYITVYIYPFLLLMNCFQFCVISIVML